MSISWYRSSIHREELTVEPAFAKMSGEPSIWTEGTAKYMKINILVILD